MHILYITQHFPPETGAAPGRAHEMAKNLSKQGNKVTILTGFPNYPDGIIPEEYRGKFYQKEDIDGIEVIRTFLLPDTKKNKWVRMLNYSSFFISSVLGGLPVSNIDIVYASIPPLPVGLTGNILNVFKNSKFVVEVRDLWVDNAIELGQLRDKWLINLARNMENFIYRRADRIVTVTRGFKEKLSGRGFDKSKIRIVTNGFDEEIFTPREKENMVREKYNLIDKFVVMYAGNMGTAQGLDFVIDAAEMTRDIKDIFYVLIGSGVRKKFLKKKAEKKKLSNILFLGLQPKEKIAEFLSAADVLLISLKNLSIFNVTVPSKVFDYLAMNRPILVGVNGEAGDIIKKAGAGLYFKPGDALDFKEKLMQLYTNRELCLQMGQSGREYALNNFSRNKLAAKLNDILQETGG